MITSMQKELQKNSQDYKVPRLKTSQEVKPYGIQNVRNQNGLSVILGIANQHGNINVVAARAEDNSNEINGNPIRCYNCQGEGSYDEIEEVNLNCTLKDNLQQA
ncbi:hypothetical protein Tco_1316983 [Tanacetum coccineum]